MHQALRAADPVGRLLTDPEVATPAFVIDDEKLEANLAFARERAAQLGVTLRPHLKTHKSIDVARRQMLSPEGPATVSTLAEARYFAEHGVKDLIYAVGIAPQKLAEVAAIRALGCDLKIILDNVAAAEAVSAFCKANAVTMPVLIEVDCDGHRSGVRHRTRARGRRRARGRAHACGRELRRREPRRHPQGGSKRARRDRHCSEPPARGGI